MYSSMSSLEYPQRNKGWWERRTKHEKKLALKTILIGIAIVIGFLVILYKIHRSDKTNYASNNLPLISNFSSTCETSGCIETASKVLKFIDETVDPCDDFYQFACGNFIKNTNIPDDKATVSSFNIVQDLVLDQLRVLIEEPVAENEPRPFKLLKQFYKACMNTKRIEEEGLTTIRSILKGLGGWPVLEGTKWNEEHFNWINSVYNFKKIGYSLDFLLSFSVTTDPKNSSRRIIVLDQADLGLDRDFLVQGFKEPLEKSYYDYMVDIARHFGADNETAKQELAESLDFEIKLANISLPNEKRRNSSVLYNPMTIRELQNKYPSIPWIEYINTLLAPDNSVSSDEVVIVNDISYISEFELLINSTSKRVQANYVMWRLLKDSISYLNEEVRQSELEYFTVVEGASKRELRWKECVRESQASMSIAMGALYVRNHFSEKTRELAKELVGNLRETFMNILKNVDWMDEKTRINALDKAKSMVVHIGYAAELNDNSKLEEYHKDLEIDDNFLKSILNLSKFVTRFLFKRLREPVNRTDWITRENPIEVNAVYQDTENSIQLLAGILQGVFFDAERPRYMNYGAIGFIIGHEITHGFDDEGRQFDKIGDLVDWWAPSTKIAFEEKAQCIIDQYGNYTFPKLNLTVNAINTQGENIADNGGIKEAYIAYNNWVKKNGEEPNLPGLKYNARQLFWISSANIWCAKPRDELLKQNIVSDAHSPENFRVNGALSNMVEFSKDFECGNNSRMNPVNKCFLW